MAQASSTSSTMPSTFATLTSTVPSAAMSSVSQGLFESQGLNLSCDTTISANQTHSFAALFPYSAGLQGINQSSNFLYVHINIITFCILTVFVVLLCLLKQYTAHLRLVRHVGALYHSDHQHFWKRNRTEWWPWLKQHFFYASLGKVRHNREFQFSSAYNMGTLPSRGHTFLLVAWFVTNMAYCLAVVYRQPVESTVAQLRGRTGTLAALNIVPTVLFASRNNPLIWILQVPYDTFNLFHRWLARLAILESTLHILFWAGNTVTAGGWYAVYEALRVGPHAHSFTNGLVGGVVMLVIAIQAWSPLRHAFYEAFINGHRLAVLVALITVYMHLDLDNLPQKPWLITAAYLWGFEWLLRTYRILYYNFSLRNGITRMTIESLPGEAVRVTCKLANPMRLLPGSHAHIYIPTMALWSSHPFSIAWGEDTRLIALQSELDKLNLSDADYDKEFGRQAKPMTRFPDYKDSISFICRVRTGFTRDMYNRAVTKEGMLTTWGFVEGPYGSLESFASYGTVLLFAGGVGITNMLWHVRQLVDCHQTATGICRRVILVWTMQDDIALNWVESWMNEILGMRDRPWMLYINIYVTRPHEPRTVTSDSNHVVLRSGRCPIEQIVDEQFEKRDGAMVVSVCGPGGFADEVRRATRTRVQWGVLDFVEEAFTY